MDSSNSISSMGPALKKTVVDTVSSQALDGIQTYASEKELLPPELIKQLLKISPIASAIRQGKVSLLNSAGLPFSGYFLLALDAITASLGSGSSSKEQGVLDKLSSKELDAIAELIPSDLPFSSNLKSFIQSKGKVSSDQGEESLLQFKAFLLAGIVMGSGKISEGSQLLKEYGEKIKDYGKGVLSGEAEPIPVSILVYLNQILENENSFSAIRKSSEYLFNLGKKINRVVLGLTDKSNPNNLLPNMIKGGEIVYNGLKSVEKDFVETVGNVTAHTFLKSIHNAVGITGTFNKILNFALKNSKTFDEFLEKINTTFRAFTPAKVMGCVFVSLNKFSQLTHEVNLNKDIQKKDQLKYKLFHAGDKKMLPSAAANEAFHLVCNPRDYGIGMRKNYIHQLNQGFDQGTGHFARQVEKEFIAFCQKNGVDQKPPEELELVKAAFMADKLCPVTQEGHKFLAKMILLDPQKYANQEELDVEKLAQQAAVLYIKKSLGPTIVDKFFPDSLRTLIGAANRIKGGEDIYDKIYTAIAQLILQNGVSILRDPRALAQSILPLVGIDSTRFSNKIVGDGSPENIENLFKEVLTKIDTPEFENSLKSIMLHPNENLKIANKATIQDCVDSQKDKSPVPTHILNSLGNVVDTISKRDDWALFLMLTAGELDHGLQKPEDVQPIDITKSSTITSLKDILQALYPSTELKILSYIAKVLHFVFQSRVKDVQTKLTKMSFFDYKEEVKPKLLKFNLTNRFIHCPQFQQMYSAGKDHKAVREGMSVGFELHLKKAVKQIWGVESSDAQASKYETEYMEYLAAQEEHDLFKVVAQVESDPKKIQEILIKKHESDLEKCQSQMDKLLLKAPQLPTIPSIEFIENALQQLQKIETPTKEIRKEIKKLSQLKEMIDLHAQTKKAYDSLSDLYQARSGQSRITDEKTLAVDEKSLKKMDAKIKKAEDNLKKQIKAKSDQASIKKSRDELIQLKTEYATKKKNLMLAKQELVVKKANKNARRSALNANGVFSQLKEEKIKLLNLLSAPILDEGEITKSRKNIQKLEEKVKVKFSSLSDKEKDVAINGRIDPNLQEKLNCLEKLVKRSVLKNDPVKNREIIGRYSNEISQTYESLLNFDFRMGLGQEGLSKKIEKLTHLKKSLVLEIETNKKQKNSDAITFYSEKGKKMESDLFQEQQINDSIEDDIKQYTLSIELSKKKEILQKRLDPLEKIKREYIQTKEESMSRLGRLYQYWSDWKTTDATLKELDARIDSIIAERNLLEDGYQTKGYDEDLLAHSDLSQIFKAKDLDGINKENALRREQFKDKTAHLKKAIDSLRKEEEKLRKEGDLFDSNQELGKQLKDVETELRCLRYLQKNGDYSGIQSSISGTLVHPPIKLQQVMSSIKNALKNFITKLGNIKRNYFFPNLIRNIRHLFHKSYFSTSTPRRKG